MREKAKKVMQKEIPGWNLQLKSDMSLNDIGNMTYTKYCLEIQVMQEKARCKHFSFENCY